MRDTFKEGDEEAWLDKVMQIKAGYEKHNEATKVFPPCSLIINI